jgi:phospholipid/cholesterol/gamma-HCH transport system substrate-binding protein
MRSPKINYLIVGLFVCAMIAVLVVSIAMVTGRTGVVDPYYTVYDNVTGVKYGTQVIYEGYPIGQVEKVTPGERDGRMEFRVDFTVTQGWRIPEDSQIEIAAPSLLSAVALQIHAGVSRDSLKGGDRVNSRAATSVFGTVSTLAEEVAVTIENDVKPLIRELTGTVKEVKRFVSADGNALMGEVTGLIRDISDRVPVVADNIQSFSANIDQASAELRRTISPSNRKSVEKVIAEMDQATSKFRDVLKTMDKVLEDVDQLVVDPKADIETVIGESRYVVETVSRHIDSINQNLEAASRNMNEFSRQIRANPGLLLGGSPQTDQTQ